MQFRQWASRMLRDCLVRGYALDRQRPKTNAAGLEATLNLVRATLKRPELTAEAGTGLADIITRHTQTLLWRQRYDEGLLTDLLPTSHPFIECPENKSRISPGVLPVLPVPPGAPETQCAVAGG